MTGYESFEDDWFRSDDPVARPPLSKSGVVHYALCYNSGTVCRDDWEGAKSEPRATRDWSEVTCRLCLKYR